MDKSFIIAYACEVSEAERIELKNKCSQLSHPVNTRLLSKLGYGMLKYALLKNTGFDGNIIDIKHGKYGKPYVNNSPFFFNISHSHNSVVCCFSSHEVGIDIELVKGLSNWNILKSFFSKTEFNTVISADNKDDKFTEIWAMKESYLKMLGTGLHKPLSSFSVSPRGENYEIFDSEKNDNRIILRNIFNNYKVAVCTGIQHTDVELINMQAKTLINYI